MEYVGWRGEFGEFVGASGKGQEHQDTAETGEMAMPEMRKSTLCSD